MSDLNNENFRRMLLFMRLYQKHTGPADLIVFGSTQLWTFINELHVFVFVLPNQASEPVVLRDEKHQYPSDTLLSQLRLLGL